MLKILATWGRCGPATCTFGHHMCTAAFSGAQRSFALDTNVSSYILDGDLWSREPMDLLPYMYLGSFPVDVTLKDIEKSKAVRRCLACLNWARQARQGGIPLLVTPTVVVLFWAKQVRIKVC